MLGQLEDLQPTPYDLHQVLPEEEQAVNEFALEHPRDGYRRLTWMMVDQDIAYLKPTTVYRILDKHNLLSRWKPSGSAGRKPPKPEAPHEQWHTDLMYLWIGSRWYFFIGVLDGYSRYIVHWDLLASMRADEVTDVIHEALEKHPGFHPKIVHDNGTQFTSREFRNLVKRFSLKQIHIRVHHPQSNGKIERFHRTLRQEGLSDKTLVNQLQARDIIGEWVEHYNRERLHAGLAYLTPEDLLEGRKEARIDERKKKLELGRLNRYRQNLKRRQEEMNCQRAQSGALPPNPQDLPHCAESGSSKNRVLVGLSTTS
jgi:putative transposase